jgi:hypothetical protein
MKIRNAVIFGLVAMLISACGASDAGSAASISGVKISESVLADALIDLSSEVSATELGISEAELTLEVLNRLVISELIRQVGEQAQVTVSETEVAAERSRVVKDFGSEAALIQAGLQQAIAPSLINSVFEISLFVSKIGQKLEPTGSEADQTSAFESFLFSFIETADIQVSPRYGTWDSARATVVAPENPLVNTPQE